MRDTELRTAVMTTLLPFRCEDGMMEGCREAKWWEKGRTANCDSALL